MHPRLTRALPPRAQIFAVKQVEVVKEVAVDELQATLKWLVDTVNGLKEAQAPAEDASKLSNEKFEEAMEAWRKDKEALEAKDAELAGSIDAAKEEVAQTTRELEAAKAELERANRDLAAEVASLKEQLEAKADREEVKAVAAEVETAVKETVPAVEDRLNKKLDGLASEFEKLQSSMADQDKDGPKVAGVSFAEVRKQVKPVEDSLNELNGAVAKLAESGDRLPKLEADLAQLKDAYEALARSLGNNNDQAFLDMIAAEKARIDALEEQLATLEEAKAARKPPALQKIFGGGGGEVGDLGPLQDSIDEIARDNREFKRSLEDMMDQLTLKADRAYLESVLSRPTPAPVVVSSDDSVPASLIDAIGSLSSRLGDLDLLIGTLKEKVDGKCDQHEFEGLQKDIEGLKRENEGKFTDLAKQLDSLFCDVVVLKDQMATKSAEIGSVLAATDGVKASMKGLEVGLGAKADKNAVDSLKLQIGTLRPAEGGGGGGAAVLDAIDTAMMSKADREEVARLAERAADLARTVEGLTKGLDGLKGGAVDKDRFAEELNLLKGDVEEAQQALRRDVDGKIQAVADDLEAMGTGGGRPAQASSPGSGGGKLGDDMGYQLSAKMDVLRRQVKGHSKSLADVEFALEKQQNQHLAKMLIANKNFASAKKSLETLTHLVEVGFAELRDALAAKLDRKDLGSLDLGGPDIDYELLQKLAEESHDLIDRINLIEEALRQKPDDRDIKKILKELNSHKQKLKDVTIKKTTVKAGKKAMLSGKQLQGFRCMACDRPLNKLGRAPGKHISTNALINHVDHSTDKQRGLASREGGRRRPPTRESPGPELMAVDATPHPAEGSETRLPDIRYVDPAEVQQQLHGSFDEVAMKKSPQVAQRLYHADRPRVPSPPKPTVRGPTGKKLGPNLPPGGWHGAGPQTGYQMQFNPQQPLGEPSPPARKVPSSRKKKRSPLTKRVPLR